MASPITTTTQISAPVNVILQAEFLKNAKAHCPYFVGSQPAEIAEHAGSFTAKWRDYANLTAVSSALSELTGNLSLPTRDAVQPSVTDVTKAVSKYGNHILLNEEVDLVNPTQQEAKLSEVLGINCGESLNNFQRDEMEDNATLVYANGSADTDVNTIIAKGDIDNVFNTLQRNNARKFHAQSEGSVNIGTAPVRASFWGITHYDVEWDIRQMTGFQDVITYSGQVRTAPGEFGHIGGVRFISSSTGSIVTDTGATGGTNVRETTNNKADLYSTVIIGQDAVGSLGLGMEHIKETYDAGDKLPGAMMFRVEKSHSIADPYAELCSMGWKSWHAAKILKGVWIRTILSAATVASAYS